MKLLQNRFCTAMAVGLLATGSLMADTFAVTPTDSADTLVNSILGSGVTLVGTSTLSSMPGQTGTFTNFSSGPYTQGNGTAGSYTIPSGIILTNGRADGAAGNYSGGASYSMGGAGVPELDTLAGGTTYDAAVLKFSFKSTSPTLYFNFAFASTEYPQYVGSQFNDVFGLFVNGKNVGVVPGTTTPITVNSVNADTNPNYFTQYSNDSTPFNYGGVTTLLTATANVSTTDVNTIEFAIADTADDILDSAVLIQGNSLGTVVPGNPTPTPTPSETPEPATFMMTGSAFLLTAGVVVWRKKKLVS